MRVPRINYAKRPRFHTDALADLIKPRYESFPYKQYRAEFYSDPFTSQAERWIEEVASGLREPWWPIATS